MNMNQLPSLDYEAGFVLEDGDAAVNGRLANKILRGIAVAIGVLV